jgi:S1-C subfamily serine protease
VTKNVGGCFGDAEGKVVALWQAFSFQEDGEHKEAFRALPTQAVISAVEALRAGTVPIVTSLAVELLPIALAKARAGMNLPEHWCKKLEQISGGKRHVLSIKRTAARTDAATKLQNGDLLLAVNGKTVSKFQQVDDETQGKEEVEVTVIRQEADCAELTVTVKLHRLPGFGTDRVVQWSGMQLQGPHWAVSNLGYMPPGGGGVYCSRWCYGSPAHKYGLRATIWVVEVNGEPVADLDAFVATVDKLEVYMHYILMHYILIHYMHMHYILIHYMLIHYMHMHYMHMH